MMTPCLRFHAQWIEENALRLHHRLRKAGIRWAPFLPCGLPDEISEILRKLTDEASCCSSDGAEYLTEAGFQSVIVTRPIVGPDELRRISRIAGDRQLTLTVDHFRHAELLAEAMLFDTTVQVLIDVDLGQQTTGVRPGPDSIRLAQAIVQLRSLTLRGVIADDARFLRAEAEGDQTSIEDVLSVAGHCRRMIEIEGVACPETVSGKSLAGCLMSSSEENSEGCFEADSLPERITTCLVSPFSMDRFPKPSGHITGTGWAAGSARRVQAPIELVCRVVSRPSLEWCVVNVGTGILRDIQTARTTAPSGGYVIRADDDVATLMLSGDSLDLRIGDEVALVTSGLLRSVPGLPQCVVSQAGRTQ